MPSARWTTWTVITSIAVGLALAWFGWMPIYQNLCVDGELKYSDAGPRFAALFQTVVRMGIYALLLPLLTVWLQRRGLSRWQLVNTVAAMAIVATTLYSIEFVFFTGHDFSCS